MNIIHILTITILLSTYSTTEETKYKQRILLRKLLSNQKDENKPMWNEVLADVLVNKIKIFSFKKQNTKTESITELDQEKSALTNFISQVFLIYKKFIYDVFIEPPEPPTNTAKEPLKPEIEPLTSEIEERNVDPDDIVKETNFTFGAGPKGEVEIIEPRYHGKQVIKNETEDVENSESVKGCPEGTVKEKGECVNNSRLIFMVPNQCPIGYRRDRLGYCRMMF